MSTLILLSCQKNYYESDNASVINKSDSNIILLKGYQDYWYNSQDTVLYEDISVYELSMKSIKPNETFHFYYWNKSHKDAISAADTFSVFIISEQTIIEKSWKEICSNYLVLCRYDISGKDIVDLDYFIPYPPTPAMQNMKMYPSYEEIIQNN